MTEQPAWLAPLINRLHTADILWSTPSTSHSSKGYVVKTPLGDFFVKEGPIDNLISESDGLNILSKEGRVKIPDILDLIPLPGQKGALVLEYILPRASERDENDWDNFLGQLNQLHSFLPEHVGFSKDNHIGPLIQKNIESTDWAEFFTTYRLRYQWKAAVQEKKIPQEWSKIFESYLTSNYEHLEVPISEITLIHGDLWSGNVLFDEQGSSVFIDPAVYYGHWEVDMAMMDLFGGFPEWVKETYLKFRKTNAGFHKRKKMYQLYYLLIHVRIFGNPYVAAVKATIGS